jgi:hypothetical protein
MFGEFLTFFLKAFQKKFPSGHLEALGSTCIAIAGTV